MRETTISSERRQAIRRWGVAIDDSSSEIAPTITESAGSITNGGSLKYGSRASYTTTLHRHLSRLASYSLVLSVLPRGHLFDICCGVDHQADCSYELGFIPMDLLSASYLRQIRQSHCFPLLVIPINLSRHTF